MNALTLLRLGLAAVFAVALAGTYLAWPRKPSAEEWVLRRRRARQGRPAERRVLAVRLAGGGSPFGRRLGWTLGLAQADLRLLRLLGRRPTDDGDVLAASLLRLALLGGLAGLIVAIGLWLVLATTSPPAIAFVLPVTCAALLPALRWLRLRRQAEQARAAIRRRLPRILTGARVLLESGAVTPHQALLQAVTVYRDSAADVLREALLQQEVRRLELQQALDEVGERHRLDELRRLADAYRVATRHGTQMADLLTEFALRLRQIQHADYRERMTRAPVLMAVPALVFFVLPLLAVLLLLILYPLESAFSQL